MFSLNIVGCSKVSGTPTRKMLYIIIIIIIINKYLYRIISQLYDVQYI